LDGGDGFLYGTTQNGGGSDAGTVYRIDASARLTTLHSFAGTDGSMPFSALLDGGDGFLYGTTYTYTSTIFKIARDGSSFVKLRTLGPSEGAHPVGTLVRGDDGFLYGTMSGGYGTGATDGTLFRIGTDGLGFEVRHSFATSPGSRPVGGLLKASDGMLYGVTSEGGASGNGVIYRFNPALSDYTILH